MSTSLQAMLWLAAVLLIIEIGAIVAFMVAFRDHKLLKLMQLRIMAVFLVGGALGVAAIPILTLAPANGTCAAQVCLITASFFTIFLSMLARAVRVHVIISSKMKRVKISENRIVRRIAGFGVLTAVYLVAWMTADPPHQRSEWTYTIEVRGHAGDFEVLTTPVETSTCDRGHVAWSALVVTINVVLMLLGEGFAVRW